jgi:phenylpropionate dioxygenase-like ring-hydroxylating dioxygenase large terminal subunit
MLSTEENELLCRVGPGTPMGELMRQYWLPGLLSRELPTPDSDPRRIMLLGEQLIAFRDTNGKVGLIQNNCPHRGASLFFGRNEEAGLRCVYHGWKFDVAGNCIDMPNEPAESDFKQKVKATAYPTRERGGIVWVYMGSRSESELPPLPDLEANMLDAEQSGIGIFQRECNWMQALEGDIDTAHVGFLHQGAISADSVPDGSWAKYALSDRAPRFKVLDIDGGVTYGTYRPANPGNTYWRVAHFLFPFYTMVAAGVLGLKVSVRAWVPLDDYHCFGLSMNKIGTQGRRRGGPSDNQVDAPLKPDSTDWYGRFRFRADARNDYEIDREKQRNLQSYTGIPSVSLEDHAVTETMGPIYDRTQERLGSSDAMIIRTRRRLMSAAVALRERGVLPPGVDQPDAYRLRSGGVVLPSDADWTEATRPLQQAFVDHPELRLDVLAGVPAV